MQHQARANGTKGEVTPDVQAREDLELYQAGLAAIENFTVMKHGGHRRRSGTRLFGPAKDETTAPLLVDFIFSEDQAYVLEFGSGSIRFFTDTGQLYSGALPYEIVSPYTPTQLQHLQWAQTNDKMYFANKLVRPKVLNRFGHTNWTVMDYEFIDGPYLPINDTDTPVTPSAPPFVGATISFEHVVTTNVNGGAGFVATDIGRHYRAQVAGKWSWGTISAVNSATNISVRIKDSGLTTNQGAATWTRTDAALPVNTGSVHYLTNAAATALTVLDAGKTGQFLIEGTAYWADIKFVQSSQKVQVVVGSAVGTNETKTRSWRLGAFSDTTGWPGSVEFHDGRLGWGRSNSNPRGVGFTRSNLTNDFTPSQYDGTVTDSHGMFIDILAGRADEILWMQDAPRLQVGTASSIRSIGPASANDTLSPRNVGARLEINSGTTSVQPVKIGPSTLHAGRFGRSVTDLVYDQQVDGLIAPELSILSEHLFRSGIKQMAYTQTPESIIWCPVGGKLIGVTLERNEKVVGYHRHPTGNGEVESVAAIPSQLGRRDMLFLAVKRTINGATRRFIEVMEAPFIDQPQSEAFFVDCGLTYDGPPINTITGLGHLEGEIVAILADGAVMPRGVVIGGSTLLPTGVTASMIHVGLPVRGYIETLPAVAPSQEGSTTGLKRKVVYVAVNLLRSLGLTVGPAGGKMETVRFRPIATPMNSAPPLITGKTRVPIQDSWDGDGRLAFVCDDPLPCTIRATLVGIETQP